jgi:hypothetical protein
MNKPLNFLAATDEEIHRAVIAALGWKRWEPNTNLWLEPGSTAPGAFPPNYTQDAGAASSLLGGDYDMEVRNGTYVHITIFEPSNQWDGYGTTINRAACAAYLRSKGVAVIDL